MVYTVFPVVAPDRCLHVAGVNIGLTELDPEAVTVGLPSTASGAGQQQSTAMASGPHKASIPIAAIAGAAAGGLVAVLIGMRLPCSHSPGHLQLHTARLAVVYLKVMHA